MVVWSKNSSLTYSINNYIDAQPRSTVVRVLLMKVTTTHRETRFTCFIPTMFEVRLVSRKCDDHVRVSSTLQLLYPRLRPTERFLNTRQQREGAEIDGGGAPTISSGALEQPRLYSTTTPGTMYASVCYCNRSTTVSCPPCSNRIHKTTRSGWGGGSWPTEHFL